MQPADQSPTSAGALLSLPGRLVTIDSPSTKDVDDAISVVARESGGFDAVFCIADPTRLVKVGSSEDLNARLLGATVYNRDLAVRKMLPAFISEFRSSLLEGKERKVLAATVRLGPTFEIEAIELKRGLAKVDKRLHYEDIPEILRDPSNVDHEHMRAAQAMAHGVMNARRNRGAMVLYDLHRMVFLDEEGRLKQLARREEVVGHIIVQEMMVLFNTLVARYMFEHEIPGLYRNHAAKAAAPQANEVAQTIRTWLEAPELDLGKAESTFRMLLGKASYGPTVLGHYGVSEPCYTHASSPLRRYADLVNMRQIRAYLKGEPYPHSVDSLAVMAADLNEKAELRKEERSEGYKEVVRAHASKALERGRLDRLADHELAQAIALTALEESLPEALVEELISRLDGATVTDKITDRMLVTLTPATWAPALKAAFVRWVMEAPTRASHLLLHGKQSGWLSNVEMASTGEGTEFTGFVNVVAADGRSQAFSGSASRKKDAEQLAGVKAVLWLIGAPVDEEQGDEGLVAAKPKISGNPKGELLEYCQKRGWPMPDFSATGKGPSHAMIFSCRVTLAVGNRTYERTVSGAGNKKEAEAQASVQMLDALGVGRQSAEPKQADEPVADAQNAVNPIGALQEIAQKHKVAAPEYRFETLSVTPPKFACTVTASLPVAGSYRAEATTKQDAKKLAALAAIKAVAAE